MTSTASRRRGNKPRSPTESKLQALIVRALRDAGCTVMVVGTRGRFGPRPFSPVTPGCPDLYVLPPGRRNGEWHGLEVKRPHGVIRETQFDLACSGATTIVRSPEEALSYFENRT